ncbi:MAG: VIT1/CCC1 transporter family protein [Candidatus Velthaea sp.]
MREFAERAVRRGGLPRVPDTPERSRLERERRIREVIFGMQDGVLTTLGIVTGVGAAAPERTTIVLTGIVALIVGTLSMGAGEYLGGKSEREVVRNAIALEQREMEANPDEEFAEQVAYYRLKGFTPDESAMIVRRLAQNPDVWLHEMMRDEFGIDPRMAEGGGLRPALAMGGSFGAGAFVPLLPHLFPFENTAAVLLSIVLAAIALFTIGAFAGRLSNRNMFGKGAELVGVGAVVFIISYAAGRYIPALFGHPPVAGT